MKNLRGLRSLRGRSSRSKGLKFRGKQFSARLTTTTSMNSTASVEALLPQQARGLHETSATPQNFEKKQSSKFQTKLESQPTKRSASVLPRRGLSRSFKRSASTRRAYSTSVAKKPMHSSRRKEMKKLASGSSGASPQMALALGNSFPTVRAFGTVAKKVTKKKAPSAESKLVAKQKAQEKKQKEKELAKQKKQKEKEQKQKDKEKLKEKQRKEKEKLQSQKLKKKELKLLEQQKEKKQKEKGKKSQQNQKSQECLQFLHSRRISQEAQFNFH